MAGIWLRTQVIYRLTLRFKLISCPVKVFTHGQLYVGCSRVGSPRNLKFALMKSNADEQQIESAKNVVYREILIDT